MIHPIPSGTRDVLPDETREVRAITDTLRGVFERHGYGEIYTPALEYESVLARADMAEAQPAYRVFDETGAVLVLRSDMTVPIARVVATRYAASEPPLRFCYFAHCYRGVRPQRGQPRELLQAGIELIGSPAPEGTAEALTVLCARARRDRPEGLPHRPRRRLAVPGADGEPAACPRRPAPACSRRSCGATSSGSSRRSPSRASPARRPSCCSRCPSAAAAPRCSPTLPRRPQEAVTGLRQVHELLEPGVAERVIFDLGLVRNIGYYTGAVFEVYDPALGAPIGGGGRYDELLGALRAAACPRSASRSASTACTSRSPARSAAPGRCWRTPRRRPRRDRQRRR